MDQGGRFNASQSSGTKPFEDHFGCASDSTYMIAMGRNETNDFRPWLGRIKGRVIAHENMLRGTKRLTNS
jgi:hypothetical protein